jgi:hypothetical protein
MQHTFPAILYRLRNLLSSPEKENPRPIVREKNEYYPEMCKSTTKNKQDDENRMHQKDYIMSE